MSHIIRLGLSAAPFLFSSLFCLTASAQGQPANSPAASSALPPLPAAPPAAPAQTNAPAAAQPTAPPSGYAPPAAAQPAAPPQGYGPPPQGYSPPPPQAGWGAPPPNYGPPPPPEEEKKSGGRNVSLTFSPLHLILPVFEATVEVRLHDHVGIAAIGGYGKVKVSDILDREYTFSVWEAGGQLLFYPISTFDKGLQLGAEALYVKVNTSDAYHGTAKVSGTGSGLAIGPLVGYKVCTSGGFTFVVQGGVQFMTAKAEASDSNGTTSSDDDSNVIPLLNLNLGWSF